MAERGCPQLAIDCYQMAQHLQVGAAYCHVPHLASHLDQFRNGKN